LVSTIPPASVYLAPVAADAVIPGLVPGIQPSIRAEVRGALDPGDKRRDDTSDLSANLRVIDAFRNCCPLIPALLEAHVAVVDLLDQRVLGRVVVERLHGHVPELGKYLGRQRRGLDALVDDEVFQ